MYRPTFAIAAVGRDGSDLELGREQMQILLDALTAINRAILRRKRLPLLYRSGVVYDRMLPARGSACGDDDWQDVEVTYRKKKGDCEDLCCIHAAQLQLAGIKARAIPLLKQEKGHHKYHIVVEWPKGLREYPKTVYQQHGLYLEDPSKVLGMRSY